MLRNGLLLFVFALPLSATVTNLKTGIGPALTIVDAGATATLRSYVIDSGTLQAENVRVHYEVEGDATIERIETFFGWTCAIEGKSADCTKTYVLHNAEDWLNVTMRTDEVNGGSAKLTMTATSPQPAAPGDSNISSAIVRSHHALIVDTIADSGAGSLRAAIEAANALDVPAKIVFHLPPPVPAAGWFTITPESPLPPITTERIVVDGKSQTSFTGDTNPRGPEIAIDGRLAHYGLEVHSPCATRIEGLVLGNFDANQGLWFTRSRACTTASFPSERVVTDNYIGTDPTGTVAWPNLRGLRVDFGSGIVRNNVISGNTYSGMWVWITAPQPDSLTIEDNRIGTAADGVTPLPNGAAGMLLGPRVSADVRRNIIANHPGMGIALVRGDTYVHIRENSMRDNGGIGIDWGIDGRSPSKDADAAIDPNAPVLLASRYDAERNRTYFTVSVRTDRLPGADGSSFDLDFYANRGPDGDGETWLGQTGGGGPIDGSAFEAWVAGDQRGKWVNATSTRLPVFFARPPRVSSERAGWDDGSTSELSNAILVGD